MPSIEQRAFRRGDLVCKKIAQHEQGIALGAKMSRPEIIVVLWETGPFKGRELPHHEDDLKLLHPVAPTSEILKWMGAALMGLRARNSLREGPFTQEELDKAELAMYRGQTPQQFLDAFTKETK